MKYSASAVTTRVSPAADSTYSTSSGDSHLVVRPTDTRSGGSCGALFELAAQHRHVVLCAYESLQPLDRVA
jgi:hypothetical protein